ncbi:MULTISPECIES: hypothetical protein [Moorena]|uniref:Uncharacterized protein n=1 Tax=Moorena producens 3L TaxID=489825 RepID=F4XZQ8_9CYAN|nr:MULTISPECIES: hypothetical protein [Moorena]NEQ16030.1 hypothetical protein [Moorena sp. SIO3E2]NES85421.1 hypothetical protein [Moorena sp. SIO2B7]EGJ29826.1 hypothetical protein LYNGBM3L_58800 [Moorena producens 3L]NEP34261.1 hypothetical protein [Moorena sp. SIO3B2]NEP66735.1 hypothetical protein [Moorena sp. SIO3A5]
MGFQRYIFLSTLLVTVLGGNFYYGESSFGQGYHSDSVYQQLLAVQEESCPPGSGRRETSDCLN